MSFAKYKNCRQFLLHLPHGLFGLVSDSAFFIKFGESLGFASFLWGMDPLTTSLRSNIFLIN